MFFYDDQLVALTVKHENPELEQRKVQLLEQEEKLKLQLANLEDRLLQVLGDSQGNILENKVSETIYELLLFSTWKSTLPLSFMCDLVELSTVVSLRNQTKLVVWWNLKSE